MDDADRPYTALICVLIGTVLLFSGIEFTRNVGIMLLVYAAALAVIRVAPKVIARLPSNILPFRKRPH